MSSRKSVITDSSSSIRKAKSDTDIAMQSLKKKAEVSECIQFDVTGDASLINQGIDYLPY